MKYPLSLGKNAPANILPAGTPKDRTTRNRSRSRTAVLQSQLAAQGEFITQRKAVDAAEVRSAKTAHAAIGRVGRGRANERTAQHHNNK
jgi:hypothetical protein